jgi:hypothetical protein
VEPTPQSWNRYSYVMGRGMIYNDPDGLFPFPAALFLQATDSFSFIEYVTFNYTKDFYTTGLEGLSLLINGRLLLQPTEDFRALRGPNENDDIGLLERALSAIPIQDNSYGDCVRERRADPLAALSILGSALPKRLVPPFRVPDPRSPFTTPASVGAHYVRRQLGRAISRIAAPLTVAEGLYDWYALVRCGI